MVRKIDVMRGENHRLVQDEKSENRPEIKGDDQAFPKFKEDSLLEPLT